MSIQDILTYKYSANIKHKEKEAVLDVIKQVYKYLNIIPKQVQAGNVVVAGGCIRDLILGKPVADIDVFILNYDNGVHMNTIIQHLYTYKFVKITDEDYEASDFVVMRRGIKGYSVDIIMPNFNSKEYVIPRDLIREFPVSISQAYWTPKHNSIFVSNEFLDSMENKTIRCAYDVPQKYFDKIIEKYPLGEWIYKIEAPYFTPKPKMRGY